MLYRIKTRVKSIEFRTRVVRTDKVDDAVVATTEDIGWFVCFEGSWEAMFLGFEKPELVKGQGIEITVRGL